MEPMTALAEPIAFHSILQILQIGVLALLAGWLAEQLLDIHVRGLALVSGLAGLYLGSWLWAVGGWAYGPTVAGAGIMPLFVGALAVSGFVKLLALGASGPRW